jgi:hypothetical protein
MSELERPELGRLKALMKLDQCKILTARALKFPKVWPPTCGGKPMRCSAHIRSQNTFAIFNSRCNEQRRQVAVASDVSRTDLCVTVDVAVVRNEVLLWVVVVPQASRDLLGRAERSPRLKSSNTRVQPHEQDPVLEGKLRTSLVSRRFLPFLPFLPPVYDIPFDRQCKKLCIRTAKEGLAANRSTTSLLMFTGSVWRGFQETCNNSRGNIPTASQLDPRCCTRVSSKVIPGP